MADIKHLRLEPAKVHESNVLMLENMLNFYLFIIYLCKSR